MPCVGALIAVKESEPRDRGEGEGRGGQVDRSSLSFNI